MRRIRSGHLTRSSSCNKEPRKIRPLAHIAVSGIISISVGFYFKSLGLAFISFVSGVFIDLDHIIDYYKNIGFTINPNDVYDACLDIKFSTIYIALHSYEIVILLWIAVCFFSLSNAWKAAAIGMTQHIIFDNLTNPIHKLGYFFTYRMLKGFRKDLLIRKISRE